MADHRFPVRPSSVGIEAAPRRSKDILDRQLVRDPRLSYRALGVAVRLLSNMPGYKMTSLDLARERPDGEGRDAVRTALAELEGAGYLSRAWVRLTSGQCVTKMVVTDQQSPVPEIPASAPTPEKPAPDFPTVGGSGVKSSKSNTRKNTTTTQSFLPELVWPHVLDEHTRVVVGDWLEGLDSSVQQQLLDELAGAMASVNQPKRPIPWLRALIARARRGEFMPDLATGVEARRERRKAEAVAERQRQQARADREARQRDPVARAEGMERMRAAAAELGLIADVDDQA